MERFDVINIRILSNIPRFSGGTGIGVEDELKQFLSNCDFISESLNGSEYDTKTFLSGIKTRLYGDAHRLIACTEATTFAELKALLSDTYISDKSVAEMNQEFYNCVQGHLESTRTYFRRLKGYLEDRKMFLRNTFPEYNEAMLSYQEFEAILVFKRGTSNSGLQKHLLMSPAETLAALEVEAYTFEDAERQLLAGYAREKSPSTATTFQEITNYSRHTNSFCNYNGYARNINEILNTSTDHINKNQKQTSIDHLGNHSKVSGYKRVNIFEKSLPTKRSKCSNDQTKKVCSQTILRNIEIARDEFIQFLPQSDSGTIPMNSDIGFAGMVPQIDVILQGFGRESVECHRDVPIFEAMDQPNEAQGPVPLFDNCLRTERCHADNGSQMVELCGHTISERTYASKPRTNRWIALSIASRKYIRSYDMRRAKEAHLNGVRLLYE